jgi:hypothetical protein
VITLRSRNPVRFEFSDGISETSVTVQPDDDSGTIAAKLRRVLELEGGYTAAIQNSRFLPPAAAPEAPAFTPADRAATEERLAKADAMGWESTNVDTLPEA